MPDYRRQWLREQQLVVKPKASVVVIVSMPNSAGIKYLLELKPVKK